MKLRSPANKKTSPKSTARVKWPTSATTVSQGLPRLRNRQQAQGMPVLPPSAGEKIEPLSGGAAGQQRAGKNEMARITPEELDYIRTAAIGDMLGDSRAFDEMGPSAVIFRLCVEIKKLRKERNENSVLIRFIIGRLEAIAQ